MENFKEKTLLFAYGSMKKGFKNNFRLSNNTYLGTACTIKSFCMYPAWHYRFPYVLEGEGVFHISGEVYEVDEAFLSSVIDKYEGVPTGNYRRSKTSVILDGGEEVECQLYFSGSEIVPEEDMDLLFPLSAWPKEMEDLGYNAESYMQKLGQP